MAVTVHTLQAVSVIAERALFGQPDFAAMDFGTSVALNASVSPNGQDIVRMFKLCLSYSAAPVASLVEVKDGATTIWQQNIPAAAAAYQWDFSAKPLRGSAGNSLWATVGSSGSAAAQTLVWTGDTLHNSQGT